MPTYEYECRSCKHRFEAFQSMFDDALIDCPECKDAQLRRLIGGGTGIIFKGSGFYVNDARKAASAAKSQSRKTSESTSGETSTGSGKSGSSDKKEKTASVNSESGKVGA